MTLPAAIYSCSQVRAVDAHAIGTLGIPGYTLMTRAGEAAFRILRGRWPTATRIAVVCGGGNNGGDGYVMARIARAAGLAARVLAVVPRRSLDGDAQRACDDFVASHGALEAFAAGAFGDAELIVDALLGTGARAPLRDDALAAIRAINGAGRPILALDLPSGLDGDSGLPLAEAVRADATVTFVGLKSGLFLGDGPRYAGTIYCDELGIAAPARPEFAPRLERILESEIAMALPRRARAAHKGTFGRVLIVGGGPGMPGAVRLAGDAALRVGAGLVVIATAPEHLTAVVAQRPELICRAVTEARQLEALIADSDVIAVGPGLGRSDWARSMLALILAAAKPIVLDADALNLLAAHPLRRDDWILTPHPGEAARLLGLTVGAVQADRLAALQALCGRYGGVTVLKGAGTLVGRAGETPGFCERGNPGMASAGMGDVLTGAIVGVLAQCADQRVAARVGVLAHALAGDAAARGGERGLLASDVAKELRNQVNWP
ncbi:MAG: NAD(P)H-hydrate dehydratase [Steroidobacteraceae bacterium]